MKKSASLEAMDVDACSYAEPIAEHVSSGGSEIQRPPVEVHTGFRSRRCNRNLRRRGSVELHPVLGIQVATGLLGVMQGMQTLAIGSDTPAVGTPAGSSVEKTQSSHRSAFAAVGTPSVIRGSDVVEANTQLMLQTVKLHPVLGIFVPTRRRTFGCRRPRRSVPLLF